MTATTDNKTVKVALSVRNWVALCIFGASVIGLCGGWCQAVRSDLKDLTTKIESEARNRRESIAELRDVDKKTIELIDRLREKDNEKLDTIINELHRMALDVATLKAKQEPR